MAVFFLDRGRWFKSMSYGFASTPQACSMNCLKKLSRILMALNSEGIRHKWTIWGWSLSGEECRVREILINVLLCFTMNVHYIANQVWIILSKYYIDLIFIFLIYYIMDEEYQREFFKYSQSQRKNLLSFSYLFSHFHLK